MALRAVPDHPKFAQLKALLGQTKGPVLGWLEAIWHFTGLYTPLGNIGKYPNKAIEAWVEWTGKPGYLILSLVKSGWLDPDKEHRLLVHDWPEHADKATKNWIKRHNAIFCTPTERTFYPEDELEYTQCTPDENLNFKCGGLPVPEPDTGSESVPGGAPSSTTPSSGKNHPTSVRPQAFVETWNQLRQNLPQVERFTDSRRKKVQARINQGISLATFEAAVRACTEKPFLRGDGERGWVATFDWLIDNDRNIEKAITGYNGTAKGGGNGKYNDIEAIGEELIREHNSGLDEPGDLPWGQDGQDALGSLRETVGARKQ